MHLCPFCNRRTINLLDDADDDDDDDDDELSTLSGSSAIFSAITYEITYNSLH